MHDDCLRASRWVKALWSQKCFSQKRNWDVAVGAKDLCRQFQIQLSSTALSIEAIMEEFQGPELELAKKKKQQLGTKGEHIKKVMENTLALHGQMRGSGEGSGR
jgi:hypothetical protein